MAFRPPSATPEGWKRVTLDAADSSADPSALVVPGSISDDGTKTTITIDRNKGAAKLIPSLAAMWYFDTDVQAQDQFAIDYIVQVYNHATLQSSNICVYAGITSDPATPDTYHYGGGIDYQLANARARRFKGSALAVGSGGANTRGWYCKVLRSGGTNAGCGNVASNIWFQELDVNYSPTIIWYDLSQSAIDAASPTGGIKFFIGIGIVNSVASNVDVEFAVWRSPLIKRV